MVSLPKEIRKPAEVEIVLKERAKCRTSFLYFLKAHGKVLSEHKGVTDFQTPDYIISLANDLETGRDLIILKARQLFISTLGCHFVIWKSLFFEGSRSYLSAKEDVTYALIEKCKLLWEFLPPLLKIEMNPDQAGKLGFPDMRSSIIALPATADAGRITGATVVWSDEMEFHPYAERNFLSIRPSLSAGGQHIMVSTVDQFKTNSFFKLHYLKSKDGVTGYKPIFLGCMARPDRDESWYEKEKKAYVGLGFEQENPMTEAEALAPLKIAYWFDSIALHNLYGLCRSPIEERENGLVKIYGNPLGERKYIMAVDPSTGLYDPCSVKVIDWQTMTQVAGIDGKISEDKLAIMIMGLYKHYHEPYTAVETNYDQGNFARKIEAMGATKQYRVKPDRPGWWTSSATRPPMLLKLKEMVDKQLIGIVDKEDIAQFQMFAQEPGEKPMALRGAHDDRVMAWAIAVSIQESMPGGRPTFKFNSARYGV